MSEIYIPLISGFVGALIGAFASITTIWIQAKIQDKRERLRHAADLALEDYKLNLDMANNSGEKYSAPPIVLFLHYHLKLMELMEKGDVTPENLKKLAEENSQISKVTREITDTE